MGCTAGGLDQDLGVVVDGDVSQVRYTVSMGALKAAVDWANITGDASTLSKKQIDASNIEKLVRGFVDFQGPGQLFRQLRH